MTHPYTIGKKLSITTLFKSQQPNINSFCQDTKIINFLKEITSQSQPNTINNNPYFISITVRGHPISPDTFNPPTSTPILLSTLFPTSLCIADSLNNFPATQLQCLCMPSANSNFTTLWLYDLPFFFIYLHFYTCSFVYTSPLWLHHLCCYSSFHPFLVIQTYLSYSHFSHITPFNYLISFHSYFIYLLFPLAPYVVLQWATKFTNLLELGEDMSAVLCPLKNKDLPRRGCEWWDKRDLFHPLLGVYTWFCTCEMDVCTLQVIGPTCTVCTSGQANLWYCAAACQWVWALGMSLHGVCARSHWTCVNNI